MPPISYKHIYEYILSSIDGTGYDITDFPSNKDRLQFVKDTFKSEYGWSIERNGEHAALREWLMGLPSSINIEYRNYEILKLGEAWGLISNDSSENKQYQFLDRWFSFMATRIQELWREYNVT